MTIWSRFTDSTAPSIIRVAGLITCPVVPSGEPLDSTMRERLIRRVLNSLWSDAFAFAASPSSWGCHLRDLDSL